MTSLANGANRKLFVRAHKKPVYRTNEDEKADEYSCNGS